MTPNRKGIANKVQVDYGINDYYNFYRKNYKSSCKRYKVDKKKYTTIIDEFNKLLFDHLVYEGQDLILPYHLGIFGIRKYKPELKLNKDGTLSNKLPINWVETSKLWEKDPVAKKNKVFVRYLNKHSGGYLFSFHYFKTKARFKNKKVYTIKATRKLQRTLAQNIKNNIIDAYEY